MKIGTLAAGALGQYAFYAGIAGMKIGLFYYIARVLPQNQFTAYHLYLYYTDIALTVVSAGTITYLTAQSDVSLSKRLGVAFRCENALTAVLLSALACAIALGVFRLRDGTSLALVVVLAIARVNTNLFSRYYLFGGRLPRSLVNDLFANWLWTIALAGLLMWDVDVSLSGLLALWLTSLVATTCWNIVMLRGALGQRLSWLDIRGFVRAVAGSFFFVSVGNSYFGFEKLVFLHRFPSAALFSSYVFVTRVVGALAEVSINFLGLFMSSRVREMNDPRERYFDWIIGLAAGAYGVILVLLLSTGNLIQAHFADKITPAHLWLVGFVVVQAFLFRAVSMGTLYFQRFRRLAYRNMTGLLMLTGLAVLYFTDLTPPVYLTVQIGLLGTVALVDFVSRRLVR